MATERDIRRLGPEMYNGIGKGSTAFKLLASMGWKEGEGLGASKQGIKEHLKVKKKFDTLGMGAAEAVDRSREWTAGMWNYDRVLSKLKVVTAQHAQHDDSGDDDNTSEASTSSSSGGEDSAGGTKGKQQLGGAVGKGGKGPAGKGTGAGPKGGKAGKGGSSGSSSSSGGGSSSSSGGSSGNESDSESDRPDTRVSAPVSARVRMASHAGRYQKRERAKLVKGYSAQDLAAILGAAPVAAAGAGTGAGPRAIAAGKAPTPTPSGSEATSSSSSSSASSSRSSGGASESSSSDTEAVQRAAGGGPGKGKGEKEVVSSGQPLWWASYFVRSGRVGGAGEGKRSQGQRSRKGEEGGEGKIRISGFREQDQEDLYHAVQDAATHGKQGLGRTAMPKKVAGARWCGTKTKIGSDSEGGDEEDEESDVTRDSNDEAGLSDDWQAKGGQADHTHKITILAPKSTAATATSYPAAAAPPTTSTPAENGTADAAAVGGKAGKRGKKGDGEGASDKGGEEGVSTGEKKEKKRKKRNGGDGDGAAGVVGQQEGKKEGIAGKKQKKGKKEKGPGDEEREGKKRKGKEEGEGTVSQGEELGKERKRAKKQKGAVEGAAEDGMEVDAGAVGSEEKPKKKKQKTSTATEGVVVAGAGEEAGVVNGTGVDGPKKVKWAKLVRSLLLAAPKRRLTLDKLKKQVLSSGEVEAVAAVPGTCREQLHKQLLKKVNSSGKFTVEDGVVRLAE